jgi:DNA-directed RNA polymerase specialized sigma24 family protein
VDLSQPSGLSRQDRYERRIHDEQLAAAWRHGFDIAYRMLGSVAEAEDVAQESVLRLTRQEEHVVEPLAWITTVATRLSINVLRSARSRREAYVGPWLPEPLVEDPSADPAAHAELADSLSLALLVLLERLTPTERAASSRSVSTPGRARAPLAKWWGWNCTRASTARVRFRLAGATPRRRGRARLGGGARYRLAVHPRTHRQIAS